MMGSEEHRSVGASPRVLLTGMMGTGKTTVGRALAAITGWPFLDNDELVERATGQPTPDVLARTDEATMRRAEIAALDDVLAAVPPLVAGVAAGVVLDPEARKRMSAGAFVVYLRTPLTVLAERVGDGAGRPWLDGEPLLALQRLYAGREPLYLEVADLVLDVEGVPPEDLAAAILGAL
ncbi:MAG: hypothetical protein MUP92_04170 [Actinobacteria bacterium]|nr:hypothetical protein [Actinomycetota bacterium]